MELQKLTNEQLYNEYRQIKLKISVIDLLISDNEDKMLKMNLLGKVNTRTYTRLNEMKKTLLSILNDYKYFLYDLEEKLLDSGYLENDII